MGAISKTAAPRKVNLTALKHDSEIQSTMKWWGAWIWMMEMYKVCLSKVKDPYKIKELVHWEKEVWTLLETTLHSIIAFSLKWMVELMAVLTLENIQSATVDRYHKWIERCSLKLKWETQVAPLTQVVSCQMIKDRFRKERSKWLTDNLVQE